MESDALICAVVLTILNVGLLLIILYPIVLKIKKIIKSNRVNRRRIKFRVIDGHKKDPGHVPTIKGPKDSA